MVARRQRQFVNGQLAWMLATVVLLSAFGLLSFELFFLASLVGLLVLVELTSPVNVTPQWRARLKWIILLGLVGFAYFMVQRILAVLPSGAL